jgi:hypothetical protein
MAPDAPTGQVPPQIGTNKCTNLLLPLGTMMSSFHARPTAAKAAFVSVFSAFASNTAPAPRLPRRPKTINIMTAFDISNSNMTMIYMSPDPYFKAFKQPLDLCQFDLDKHPTGGLSLYKHDGRLHLATMSPGYPAAKMKDWRSCVKGAWLIKIGDMLVTAVTLAKDAFTAGQLTNTPSVTLLFAHPEIRPNLSHDSVPIVLSALFTQSHHNQMNNCWEFSTIPDHICSYRSSLPPIEFGSIYNVMTKVMRLTRGKLHKGPDWMDWQDLEFYAAQPIQCTSHVWTTYLC